MRLTTGIAKALALRQSSQKDCFQHRSCNACHPQLLPLIACGAMNDSAALDQACRAFDFLSDLDRAIQSFDIFDPAWNEDNELLAAGGAGAAPNLTAAVQ